MRLLVCSSRNWFKINEEISKTNTVKFITLEEELTVDSVDQFKPDYILFPHWNWIVKKDIHENYNCVVFHTAPLPYGRGGSPIQNLIMEGFQTSLVCAIKMTEKLDAGPIYSSSNISLEGNLNSIFLRLNDAVNELIVKIISKNPEPIAQVGAPHIFKRLGVEDNEIVYKANIEDFYDSIRMLDDPSYPNAYLRLENVCIEFFEISRKGEELFCKARISPSDLKK